MDLNRPDKKGNPLEKALLQITKNEDLKSIGDLIEKSNETELKVFEGFYTDKFISQLHPPGVIALIMITPLQKASSGVYSLASSCVYAKPFINDPLTKLNEHFQFSVAMRFACAACLCNKGAEVLQHEGFNSMYKSNPVIYGPPLLYIHAQIKDPLILPIQYRKEGRIDTMALYYLGVNHMLKREFQEAEFLFMKSYLLSKTCKDIRPSIIHKLSLASFLNRTPSEVFFRTIPRKHHPNGMVGSLWTLKPVDLGRLDGFYHEFEKEIVIESARRIVLDFAETSTAISVKDLAKACNIKQTELKKILDNLSKFGDIQHTITQEGIINFESVAFVQPVNEELVNVQNLFKLINTTE